MRTSIRSLAIQNLQHYKSSSTTSVPQIAYVSIFLAPLDLYRETENDVFEKTI